MEPPGPTQCPECGGQSIEDTSAVVANITDRQDHKEKQSLGFLKECQTTIADSATIEVHVAGLHHEEKSPPQGSVSPSPSCKGCRRRQPNAVARMTTRAIDCAKKAFASTNKDALRVAMQTVVGSILASLFVLVTVLRETFNNSNSVWVVITALVVIESNLGGSVTKSIQRAFGTALGCLFGYIVLVALIKCDPDTCLSCAYKPYVLCICLAVWGFALQYAKQVNPLHQYGCSLAILSASMVTLGTYLYSSANAETSSYALKYALYRIATIAVGAVIGTLVCIFVFPVTAVDQFRRTLILTWKDLGGVIIQVSDCLDSTWENGTEFDADGTITGSNDSPWSRRIIPQLRSVGRRLDGEIPLMRAAQGPERYFTLAISSLRRFVRRMHSADKVPSSSASIVPSDGSRDEQHNRGHLPGVVTVSASHASVRIEVEGRELDGLHRRHRGRQLDTKCLDSILRLSRRAYLLTVGMFSPAAYHRMASKLFADFEGGILAIALKQGIAGSLATFADILDGAYDDADAIIKKMNANIDSVEEIACRAVHAHTRLLLEAAQAELDKQLEVASFHRASTACSETADLTECCRLDGAVATSTQSQLGLDSQIDCGVDGAASRVPVKAGHVRYTTDDVEYFGLLVLTIRQYVRTLKELSCILSDVCHKQ